ncbi:hypothetical protein Tco_0090761 [Tanacetum coccineum]
MGHDTWYYSLGVSSIVDAFVRSEFGISSWRGSRVDGKTYLLSGVIDDSKANRIICDPKLELERSRFAFDLVPLSYESVDCLGFVRKRTKEDMRSRRSTKEDGLRLCDIFVVLQGATPICEGSCHLTPLRGTSCWNDCKSCKVRVGSNGNSLWEVSALLDRKEGNELVLALPEGVDDFVVLMKDFMTNVSRWMKLFSEYGFEAKYHLRKGNVDVVPWSRKKE